MIVQAVVKEAAIAEEVGELVLDGTKKEPVNRAIYAKRVAAGGGTIYVPNGYVVEDRGFEPLTFWLPAKRSPS